jgi:hypothetical protein
MRRLWSTLALIVVLGGLGAYIYFDIGKQSDASSVSKQEKVFASLQTDKIDELKIKSESGDVTTVKKGGDGWQIVAPITAKASETDVSGITSALGNAELSRVIEEQASDLKQYGLETPQIDVEFKSADGKSSGHLFVGQKTATGSSLYARRNDDPKVFLIPSFQESTFNKSTFDLRDKALMTFQRDKVDGIDVNADGKTMQLAKDGTDWKLTKPVSARADNSAVEGLVGRIETAQMKSVATNDVTPDDLKKYGLDKPTATVTLNLGSARATLLIGGKADNDNVYARDASKPTVATVEKSLVDDVKKAADDYRRKDVFEFRAFNATRVELIRKDQTVAFERVKGEKDQPDKWRRVSPNPADADREKVEKLLADLADMRVTSFVESTAKTGVDSPVLVVDAKFDEGKKEEKISFGQNGSDVYVARPGDPGAGKIDADRLTEALKQLDEVSK